MEKKTKLMQCMACIPSHARRMFTVIVMMVASVLCTQAQTLIDGIYYTLNDDATAIVERGSSAYRGDIVIPSTIVAANGGSYSVTSIGANVFAWSPYLTSVKMPNSVSSIGDYAFMGCSSLTSIEIPNNVEILRWGIFSYCKNLKSIVIPNSVTTVFNNAFSDCSQLNQIICKANTPPTIDSQTFENVNKSIPVYVPASSIEAYKSADYWSEFTNFQAIVEPAKTEWRISDRTDIEVDFHSINEAMEDERVQDGDTLYIERGTKLAEATITKKVTVVGPGYNLADDSRDAKVDLLTIKADGAKVIGLRIVTALVNENNVGIENCYVTAIVGDETNYENDNCNIHSCFIEVVSGRRDEGTFDWNLSNNIIYGSVLGFESLTANHNTIVSTYNSVFLRVTYSTITNNVVYSKSGTGTEIISVCSDNKYDKNIVSASTDNYGELLCETLEKIISCTGNANTEDYYKPVGVSVGYSTDGTDCGAYGGKKPYVKGGKSGLFVEREGEEEPKEPQYPETPITKGLLDNTAVLDIENDVYNSLGEFLKALSLRGIASGVEIAVADQQFGIALDETSYSYIQKAAVALELQRAYIYMKAGAGATFNITLSPTFAATHASDLKTVAATVVTFANHIITTNINILINGVAYSYQGFQVEPNDLLNLKNLYNALDGANWTHRKWSFLSNGRQASDFPGVTFAEANELGYSRVKEISLEKNSMKGDVTNLKLYFPELTSLNMYYNQLSGDITGMVSELSKLVSLDISYNMLTGLTSLPASVASLNKGSQFRGDASSDYLSALTPLTVWISNRQKAVLPTIMTYNLERNASVYTTSLYISEKDNMGGYFGQLVPLATESGPVYRTTWVSSPYVYGYGQDHACYLRSNDGTIYPVLLKYAEGDANMSGATDLLDVQTTITEILNPAVITLFNQSAANTYNDELINVQDVVCTVNIVLGKSIFSIDATIPHPVLVARRVASADGDTGNILFVEDERLWLTSETEVGAIEVELKGVSADEVSLVLNRKDFQLASLDIEGGSRHIIYSLSGKSVPVGTAAILRLSNDHAEVADAALSTVDAKSLSFTIGVNPTAISSVDSSDMLKARFEGNAIVISSTRDIRNAVVVVTSMSGVENMSWNDGCIYAGETVIDANLTSGVYIIGIYENGKQIENMKLMKK